MTIRDLKSGALVEVDDDGRRITLQLDVANDFRCCLADHALCEGHDGIGVSTGVVTFDKSALLDLLGGK